MPKSRLLIDDNPIMVSPKLAEEIGLNEANVLQQIHYWLGLYRDANNKKHLHDGKWWVYNSASGWQENFPWWSESTIRRALNTLREAGLVEATSAYNQKSYDRTLWYTIKYDAVEALEIETGEQEGIRQNEQMDVVKMTDASSQNEQMDMAILDTPIPETNTETISETSVKDAGASEPEPEPTERETRNAKIRELADAFTDSSRIPRFEPSNKGDYAAQEKLWWAPLKKILKLCDDDAGFAKYLISAAVSKMRRDDLVMSSPNSILKNAVSIYAERESKRNPPKRKGPHRPVRVQNPVTGKWETYG